MMRSFLCVPDAEYVSPDYPQLWYRGLPRVLTPDEIVTGLSLTGGRG